MHVVGMPITLPLVCNGKFLLNMHIDVTVCNWPLGNYVNSFVGLPTAYGISFAHHQFTVARVKLCQIWWCSCCFIFLLYWNWTVSDMQTTSMAWLLMSSCLVSPGHQQPEYVDQRDRYCSREMVSNTCNSSILRNGQNVNMLLKWLSIVWVKYTMMEW